MFITLHTGPSREVFPSSCSSTRGRPRTISMAVGQPINRDRVAAKRPQSSASGNGLTSSQKTGLVLVAALCGPALLKKWYEKPASEKVDLSGFNIVTAYDTPAIERMDSTVRIEFCSS